MATYKSAPTFTMDKADFVNYRKQVMSSIKIARMALMSDGRILLWIDEELARFPESERTPQEKISDKLAELKKKRETKDIKTKKSD